MGERLLAAAISTAIIILIVPLIGLLIDFITEEITKSLAKGLGFSVALFIMNYLTFVGTIHHECSHALYALITGAKVTSMQIFKPEGNRLGCVQLQPRGIWLTKSLQLTLSAIAPTVQGLISEILLFNLFMFVTPIWLKILVGYVMVSIFFHMTMSGADLKAALKGLPIVALIVFLICFIFKVDLFTVLKGFVRATFQTTPSA